VLDKQDAEMARRVKPVPASTRTIAVSGIAGTWLDIIPQIARHAAKGYGK
jgi:hypothetical protein